jgi:hypothetical protein
MEVEAMAITPAQQPGVWREESKIEDGRRANLLQF